MHKWNSNDQGNSRVHTTLAKQLALYVLLYSPMQMAADLPENYKNQPAFKFISSVPVSWDDTKVINAQIGKHLTIARKKGQNWYLGSATHEKPARLKIKLGYSLSEIVRKGSLDSPDVHRGSLGMTDLDMFIYQFRLQLDNDQTLRPGPR